MKVIGVIPARYQSSRFPGKPLTDLLGKPMIIRVAEIVSQALGKENTYIATDDKRIEEAVLSYGYKVVITSSNALTGTDRIAEFAKKIDADIYINVQGDEPLLDPNDILDVVDLKKEYPNQVINCMAPITDESFKKTSVPKVVTNEKKELLYMSRSVIPGTKSTDSAELQYYKQVCIYAFNKEELLMFDSLKRKSVIEEVEDIEILRFFEFGKKILMHEVKEGSLAIDFIEDKEAVIKVMQERE